MTTTIPDSDDPMVTVGRWIDEAVEAAARPNPTAMTLATAGADARVSARMVLVKGLDRGRGFAEIYTNYDSRKAHELAENAWAAGVMHWDALGRQLRFEGPVVKSPSADSDAYFASRSWRSQLNAWASRQSQAIADPRELGREARRLAERFGVPDPFDDEGGDVGGTTIPRPPFWGGYRFWFAAVEVWRSGTDRFHQRIRFERELASEDDCRFATGDWRREYLQP